MSPTVPTDLVLVGGRWIAERLHFPQHFQDVVLQLLTQLRSIEGVQPSRIKNELFRRQFEAWPNDLAQGNWALREGRT